MTSFQFRKIKEKEKSLKALSLEAHNDTNYLAFSKRSSLPITLSSNILLFLSIQITHIKDTTIHFHITLAKLLVPKPIGFSTIKDPQYSGNTHKKSASYNSLTHKLFTTLQRRCKWSKVSPFSLHITHQYGEIDQYGFFLWSTSQVLIFYKKTNQAKTFTLYGTHDFKTISKGSKFKF